MAKALEGIRVLDFGRVIASGFCGTLLADMGAEVIKVDRPGGEFDRRIGPFTPNGKAIVYDLITPRNKKSITLNPFKPLGKDLLNKLMEHVDIIISGFTPEGNQRIGIDYDSLKIKHPDIILTAISGFGQTGPNANRLAFDAVVQAECGGMNYTGFPDSPPTRSGVPYADFGAAIMGAYGTMLALFHRQRTGKGQLVDVSMMDVATTFVAGMGVVAEGMLNKYMRTRIGNSSFYTYTDAFEAKDGWVVISVIGQKIWERLLNVVKRKEMLKDTRFKDDLGRFQHRHAIYPVIASWVSKYKASEIIEYLEKARVPCGRVNTAAELMSDPQIRAREMISKVNYEEIGTVHQPGIPIKLSLTPGGIAAPAAELGAHNNEIYRDMLKVNEDYLEKLKEKQIV